MGFPILVRLHFYIESGPWAYYEVQKCKDLASDISKLRICVPVGISRHIRINVSIFSKGTCRILTFIGDYPPSMIMLACAYFGLDVIRSRLVNYCFSDPRFHHVPILINTLIQLYGLQHPYVQFLKFRLGRIWAKTGGTISTLFIIYLISIYFL